MLKIVNRLAVGCATGFLAISQLCAASPRDEGPIEFVLNGSMDVPIAKSANAQTIAARGTVTSSNTLFGGFELRSPANVYILVRGNSLGTLGITQGYLDVPRVRLYNSAGQDLVFFGGRAGFNFCLSSDPLQTPVVNYYQTVRAAPASGFDACFAGSFPVGAYTFTVTPSIAGVTTNATNSVPTFGEVLFEVTLGP